MIHYSVQLLVKKMSLPWCDPHWLLIFCPFLAEGAVTVQYVEQPKPHIKCPPEVSLWFFFFSGTDASFSLPQSIHFPPAISLLGLPKTKSSPWPSQVPTMLLNFSGGSRKRLAEEEEQIAKQKALAQPWVLHEVVLFLSLAEGYRVTIMDSENNNFGGWQPDYQRN